LEAVLQANRRNPVAHLKLAHLLSAAGHTTLAADFFRDALDLAQHAPSEILWPPAAHRIQPERALLVACTASNDARAEELLLVRSFRRNLSYPFSRTDLDISFENRLGLPEVYNSKLESAAAVGYEYAVFVHDDVYIDDVNLFEKLTEAHRQYGFHLVGAAGCCEPVIRFPSLWHVMSPKSQQRGAVSHYGPGQNCAAPTAYGPTPARVDLIDGLFISVHIPTAMAVGWRFNPSFRFHHYDLAASLDAARKGMRVGVYPVNLVHASAGLNNVEDAAWRSSDLRFREVYGK
jgi:hypothetical protein